MKYIITEDKLKKFLKRQFGIDLTGNIEMITSANQLPYEFDKHFSKNFVNRYLNEYGPMYLIKLKNNGDMILVQDRGRKTYIRSNLNNIITEEEFFNMIGMEPIMSVMDLINQYYNEEDYM